MEILILGRIYLWCRQQWSSSVLIFEVLIYGWNHSPVAYRSSDHAFYHANSRLLLSAAVVVVVLVGLLLVLMLLLLLLLLVSVADVEPESESESWEVGADVVSVEIH